MKSRRRITALVLAVTLVVSGSAFAEDTDIKTDTESSAATENEDNVTVEDPILSFLWDDSFENLRVGEVKSVSGISLKPGDDSENSFSAVETDGTRSLRFSLKSNKEMYIEKALSETVTEKAVIDMRIRLDDYGASPKSLYVRGPGKDYYQICRFLGSALLMPNGVAVGGLLKDKFYNFAFVLDFKAQTIDTYLDGRLRAKDCPFPNTALTDMRRIRFHIAAAIEKTEISIDRIRVYVGDTPLNDLSSSGPTSLADTLSGNSAKVTKQDVKEVMENAVAMYANKPNAMLKGEGTYISDDRSVMPYWEGENTMIPIRFLIENLGGSVTANANASCTASLGKSSVTFTWGEADMILNGNSITMSTPAVLKNGVTYVPLYELCEALDIYLFCESGVIICSMKDMNLSWTEHLALLRRICENYLYDELPGAEIIELLKQRWPNNGHPRLIMTEERFQMIRDEVAKGLDGGGDEFLCKVYEVTKESADFMLKTQPYVFADDGPENAGFSIPGMSEAEGRLQTLALVYNISGDERYAQRCLQEMTAISSWWYWNPQDALYHGRMVSALALAYDWLYNWMTPTDREMVKNALAEKGLRVYYDNFAGNTYLHNVREAGDIYRRNWEWWGNDSDGEIINNFRTAAGSGGYITALAIGDELVGEHKMWAETVFEGTMESQKEYLSLFAPHGAYEEGLSYWGFSSQYFLKQGFSMLTALGTDLGMMDVPGTRECNEWVMSLFGPVANFPVHDSSHAKSTVFDPSVIGWAARFEKWGEAGLRTPSAGTSATRQRDLLYYVPQMSNASSDSMKLDGIFASTGVFTARSSWDKDALWVGFHSDDAIETDDHDHMDGGTFVLQAMGEEFFREMGNDSYSIGDYRRSAYVTVAEGHNTLVLNPNSGKYAGWSMQFGGKAKFDKTHSEAGGAYVISNLTDLWRKDAASVWRGVKLDNNRKTVTVQDEIKLLEKGEVYWFGHTEADVKISEDGKTVYLDKNGKVLIGEIIHGDDAKFTVTPAGHLPGSYKPAGQKSLAGISRLTIHMEDIKEQNLMVTFNCYDDTYDPNGFSKEWVPLSEWKVN